MFGRAAQHTKDRTQLAVGLMLAAVIVVCVQAALGLVFDPRYRDFYRDIGFDLDFDYVRPHLPSPENRGFTGIKYYRITGDARYREAFVMLLARNGDLVRKYKINLEKGVPAVSLLDSTGKLIFNDKGGEFEAARRMTEEDLLAFLDKWKAK